VLGSVQPAKHLVSSSKQAGFLKGICCKLTETVSEPVGRRKASAQTELLCEPELPESSTPNILGTDLYWFYLTLPPPRFRTAIILVRNPSQGSKVLFTSEVVSHVLIRSVKVAVKSFWYCINKANKYLISGYVRILPMYVERANVLVVDGRKLRVVFHVWDSVFLRFSLSQKGSMLTGLWINHKCPIFRSLFGRKWNKYKRSILQISFPMSMHSWEGNYLRRALCPVSRAHLCTTPRAKQLSCISTSESLFWLPFSNIFRGESWM
jgi:hypothetical protein